MKRISNIFHKIIDYNNIILADENARRNKSKTYGVKIHDRNKEANLKKLQEAFTNLTYKTSEYFVFKIYEPKEREIYRLPYFPDRIAHHALMNQLEPIWEKLFIHTSYACRKKKGIHKAVQDIKKVLRRDKENTKYCLKLDVKKFYPSIDHDILKSIVRRKIKDSKALTLLDEIIDSAAGVPIGNYLSQYFANLYLTYFDHWIKEVKRVKYYFRYADDIVTFSNNKEDLHELRKDIEEYLSSNLKLRLKRNYQIFPLDSRGLDFVGYKFFHTHTLLRKSIKLGLYKSLRKLRKWKRSSKYIQKKLCAYFGWLKFCNSKHLCKKHINDLCGKHSIPKPCHIVAKEDIITNIIDKEIKILYFQRYSKYTKIYVKTNKMLCVKSKSKRIFSLLVSEVMPAHTYILTLKNNIYKLYEISI